MRLVRTPPSVVKLHDQDADNMFYWRQKSAEERFIGIEINRLGAYDGYASTDRLQRVFEVIKRQEG